MITHSTAAKILNNCRLLPISEEDRVYTSQRTISAYAMYYLDQEVSAFIKVLGERSFTRTWKQRKTPVGKSQKWSR